MRKKRQRKSTDSKPGELGLNAHTLAEVANVPEHENAKLRLITPATKVIIHYNLIRTHVYHRYLAELIESGICNKDTCETTTVAPITQAPTCEDHPACSSMEERHCLDKSVSAACPRLCKTCAPTFSNWSEWTECSSECKGAGFVTRQRTCLTTEYTTAECEGDFEEEKECEGLEYCYGPWSQYSECKLTETNTTCGVGTMSRMRVCDVPEDCDVVDKEVVECEIDCVGEWSEWSDYGTCTATCGVGETTRNRICPHGLKCEGESTETVECTLPACIFYQDWKDWEGLYPVCSSYVDG